MVSRSKALMDDRRPRKAAGLAAGIIVLLAAAVPSAARNATPVAQPDKADTPLRFAKRGLDPGLPDNGNGGVRVRIALSVDPIGEAAMRPMFRGALSGRLTASEQRAMREDVAMGPRIARRQ